jgi:Zn-dependent M28 family amino/carboxypeptidase
MKTLRISILLITLGAFFSCGNNGNDNNGDKTKDTVKPVSSIVPAFNADSAYNFVKAQVDFGPRVPNTPAHKKCGDWLAAKLKEFGATVINQEVRLRAYTGTVLNSRNIIGVFNPNAPARIMLCSHWDSRPWSDHDPDSTKWKTPVDAANDGASGVGVLLEVARQIKAKNPNIGVDIVFFDAEDYGTAEWEKGEYPEDVWGLGSQYWAKNPHKANYSARFGILLDMVAVPNANFAKEGFSMQYAPDIVAKVWDAASRAGFSNTFVAAQGGMINDDHLYVNKFSGIPTIDIIHNDRNTRSGFFQYWHTSKDNMDSVDRNTLKAVGQTLLVVIYEEGLPA